ncbi:hypothetical protein DFH08DRAFT_796760 [Mycena albidolilacea]|uniref:Uncharacterized protein n=1 Tax=Mycena albidolilacea TaxID=1033008 RepID=A0AAD7AVU3_9AGAR|nr:hypothetical protein DFH08DRAFT_796760 [Mycena albidolilacea]
MGSARRVEKDTRTYIQTQQVYLCRASELRLWLEFEGPDMHVSALSRDGTVLRVLSGKLTVDEELIIGPTQEGCPLPGLGTHGSLYLRWVRGGRCAGRLSGYGGIYIGWAPVRASGDTEDARAEQHHGNMEQIRNVETSAPHTVYTCNPVLFMLTGDKGEGQAQYALKADAEGETCTDG